MSMMQGEVYDAFIAAKVPEDKARAAAEVIAQKPQNDELATREYIEKRIAELEGRMDSKMADLKGELKAEIAKLEVEIAGLETRLTRNDKVSTSIILTAIGIATGIGLFVN